MTRPLVVDRRLPDTLTLELLGECEPWSINVERKEHYMVRAQRAAMWKNTAYMTLRSWRARENYWRHFPFTVVCLEIPFKRAKQRRDPHNYCSTVLKAVIDGLLAATAWPDDTPEWVGHREPRLVIRPGRAILRLQFEPSDWERTTTDAEHEQGPRRGGPSSFNYPTN